MTHTNFEHMYFSLVLSILATGEQVKGRNGNTVSLIGQTLNFDLRKEFPILQAREYFYRGVFGEFAAIVRGPKALEDFVKFGCGYWQKWAEKDLSIKVDYGNAWLDFNGVNQLEWVANEIKTNPQSRRLIVSGWNPANVINNNLSLPCCHYAYQFIVRGNTLHMVWIQRSADTMIGIPADAILAALWLIALANETGLIAGECTMHFADTHIYEEHKEKAAQLAQLYSDASYYDGIPITKWRYTAEPGKKLVDFLPSDVSLINYKAFGPKVEFLLKD